MYKYILDIMFFYSEVSDYGYLVSDIGQFCNAEMAKNAV